MSTVETQNAKEEWSDRESNVSPTAGYSADSLVASGRLSAGNGPLNVAREHELQYAPNEDEEAAEVENADAGDFQDLDGISSSPSIPDENINFEFVYALHTFIATIEGQANATKGDTLVLLDDSNSYWWLVRVVKDQSIGYLPAEHIETPFERLARLNKHRNIDVAAAMLGDHFDESKASSQVHNEKGRGVQFAEVTHVSAPAYEYASDEESAVGYANAGDLDNGDEWIDTGDSTEPVDGLHIKKTKSTNHLNAADWHTLSAGPGERKLGSSYLDKGIVSDARGIPREGQLAPEARILSDNAHETLKLSLTPPVARADKRKLEGFTEKERANGRVPGESASKSKESSSAPPPSRDDGGKRPRKGSILGNLFKRRSRKGKIDDDSLNSGAKGLQQTSQAAEQPAPALSSGELSTLNSFLPEFDSKDITALDADSWESSADAVVRRSIDVLQYQAAQVKQAHDDSKQSPAQIDGLAVLASDRANSAVDELEKGHDTQIDANRRDPVHSVPHERERPQAQPVWNDEKLRYFFDDRNTSLQELLCIVRSASLSKPVTGQHPDVQVWQEESNRKLDGIEMALEFLGAIGPYAYKEGSITEQNRWCRLPGRSGGDR